MGHVPVNAFPPTPVPDAGVGASSALWTSRLSASFGAIADQIAAASKALASVELPPTASDPSAAGPAAGADGALAARLEAIERSQERLAEELDAVRGQLTRLNGSVMGKEKAERPVSPEVKEEMRERQEGVEVRQEADIRTLAGAVQELGAKVEGIIETIKLDQARLYARLMNSIVTVNKMPIKAPPMANGKPPQNFPATKGEFEHLTKERYEALLKSYGQPIKGDTNAKREALREFIGLPGETADGKK
ncbi:hypothetical protein OBBRIDRAFT_814407 [Obba rivulosa]|uniref:Uncharacterized protein n=1 Tax=Obba rivulosa TaxID=1052685 RepID=A0A8E2ALJ1_9APHY|nr:hypothetical protein OBBRIDRAFT_814407 [Obba rivulosa]